MFALVLHYGTAATSVVLFHLQPASAAPRFSGFVYVTCALIRMTYNAVWMLQPAVTRESVREEGEGKEKHRGATTESPGRPGDKVEILGQVARFFNTNLSTAAAE